MKTKLPVGYSFNGIDYNPSQQCHILHHDSRGVVLQFPKLGLFPMLFLEVYEHYPCLRGFKIKRVYNNDGYFCFEVYNIREEMEELLQIRNYLNLNS
jgi:hypothetical protein